MKPLYILILMLVVFGCNIKENADDYKVNKSPTKKSVAEELSIKDIDSITARLNYAFSKNNLPIDSSSFLDTVKKEISKRLIEKKNKDTVSKK